MKKLLLLLIASALTVSAAETAKTSTVSLFGSLGYAFPRGSLTINPDMTYDRNAVLTESKTNRLNAGRGITITAGAAYAAMEHLKVTAFADLSLAVPRTKVEYKGADIGGNPTPANAYDNDDVYHMSTFGIGLTARPEFRLFDLLDCYIGLGTGLYFAHITVEGSNDATNHYEGYYKTSPSLALIGEAGAAIPLTEQLSLVAGLQFKDMSFNVYQTTTTDNPTQENYENNNNSLDDRFRIPGSTLGIKVGISYGL